MIPVKPHPFPSRQDVSLFEIRAVNSGAHHPHYDDTRALASRTLREILGRALGRAPESVLIERSPDGKPFLSPSMDSTIEFNLSHSGDRTLIALSERGRIGIDLEQHRERAHAPAIGERFLGLSPEEASDPDQFFARWCAIEALIKAFGGSFFRDAGETRIGANGIIQVPASAGTAADWELQPLELGPGWSGFVCLERA